MNERPNMKNEQMELGLETARQMTAASRPEGRRARADWWFAQMRRLVGAAINWDAAPKPRPEQPWLADAGQHARV